MIVEDTNLDGVKIITPKIYEDERGKFYEIYQADRYINEKIDNKFVQDNVSISKKNVLRGLHYQKKRPQGKLVKCLRGAVYDVVVDINIKSKTYGKWIGIELNEQNNKQIWVPPGYAHGFCVLSESALFMYKCSDYYDPNDEAGIIWNDPDLNIDWPIDNPILSVKDQHNKLLKESE